MLNSQTSLVLLFMHLASVPEKTVRCGPGGVSNNWVRPKGGSSEAWSGQPKNHSAVWPRSSITWLLYIWSRHSPRAQCFHSRELWIMAFPGKIPVLWLQPNHSTENIWSNSFKNVEILQVTQKSIVIKSAKTKKRWSGYVKTRWDVSNQSKFNQLHISQMSFSVCFFSSIFLLKSMLAWPHCFSRHHISHLLSVSQHLNVSRTVILVWSCLGWIVSFNKIHSTLQARTCKLPLPILSSKTPLPGPEVKTAAILHRDGKCVTACISLIINLSKRMVSFWTEAWFISVCVFVERTERWQYVASYGLNL